MVETAFKNIANAYHKFNFKSKNYLYNVEDMKAYRIDDALNREIDCLERNHKIEGLKNNVKEALIRLNLLEKIISSENIEKENEIKTEEIPPISRITLNVAQTCNMKCIYCYGEDGEYGEKGLMDEKLAYESVDFLIENSDDKENVGITFFGGEPLLNFLLIKKVVHYAKEKLNSLDKKINFSITTNGTLFTDEIIVFLNKNKFGVQVSFDGDKEIQDKNRPLKKNVSSYDYIVPNLKKFIESRDDNVSVRATLTKYSKSKSEVREILKGLGFNRISIVPVTANKKADFRLTKNNYNNIGSL